MHLRKSLFGLAVLLLPLEGSILAADSIVVINPSFQAQDFPDFPGYINSARNPATITGWTGTGGVGVNGTDIGAGTPFADNGNFPDNTRVAFIQGTGSLSQDLNGFVPGSVYWVQGFANARDCCGDLPRVSVTMGTNTLLPPTTLAPVGNGNPYVFVNLPWTANASSATLSISSAPSAGGDASLTIDGISVIRRTAQDIVIANPSFEASGNSFGFPGYIDPPFTAAGWTRNGTGGIAINGSNSTNNNPFADNGAIPEGGNVIALQNTMAISQTLLGLTAGRPYRLTLDYNARTGDDPTANIVIDGKTALQAIIAEVGGSNPYYHLDYQFVASGSSAVLSIGNLGTAADSTLLVDNVRVVAVPEPTVAGCSALGLALMALRRRRSS